MTPTPIARSGLMFLPSEIDKLLVLGPAAWSVFGVLLMFSDFKTGFGRCSFDQLVRLLTPPRPGNGHKPAGMSRDDVRNWLRRFVEEGLMSRDRERSERDKAIFFMVSERTGKALSDEVATRLATRPDKRRKRATARVPEDRAASSYPTSYPPAS